jgi:hypothetical protein
MERTKAGFFKLAIGSNSADDNATQDEFYHRLILAGFQVDASGVISITTPPSGLAIDASQIVSGTVALARISGLTNTQIAVAAGIVYSKLNLAASLVNADVAVGAAIAYAKLNLSAAIVNADIAVGASIAYAKLNLAAAIVNADIAVAAAIAWSKIDKTGSSLADLSTRSAADLSSGILPDARVPGFTSDGASRILGLAFKAAQTPSADANTLDDYEEKFSSGWTPADGSGAALVLTINDAWYIKIGRLVIAAFDIGYPVTADGSEARISGVPFTATGNVCGGFTSYANVGQAVSLSFRTSLLLGVEDENGAHVTNSSLSGKTLRGTLLYPATA